MSSSTVVSNCDDSHNGLCIICCRSFLSNDQPRHGDKSSKLCDEFLKVNWEEKEKEEFNFLKTDFNSGENFGDKLCPDCLIETNELITSKDKVIVLEDHVISLQKQILQSLRELEECLKGIKCHQKNLKKKLECSEESTLDGFPLKLRRWIMNDFVRRTTGKLKGNLWISEESTQQPILKVEPREEEEPFDLQEDSSCLWDADEDDDKDTSGFKNEVEEEHQWTAKTSRMTLRTRDSKKPSEIPINPISMPKKCKTNLIKSKIPKKESTKQAVSQVIKKTPIPITKKKGKVTRSCELCSITTRDDPLYEQHIREHETEEKPLQCPQCPLKFSTNQYFKFHQKCHQGLPKMICDVCRKAIPVLSLANHIKSHFPPEGGPPPPKIIYCQNCSFCCTKRQVYLTHIRRHFASRKVAGKFSCDICSKEYPSPSGLLKHFHESHEGALEKWTCDVENCGKSFPCRQYLVRHKWMHKNEDSVPCSKCNKKFATVHSMEVHFRVHSGDKPFPCDECDERFRAKASLEAHKRRDHGAEKLKCKICGKEYINPAKFKYHVAKHENKGFHCETCGKIFGNVQILEKHLSTHSEEKRLTCEQCGKMFKGNENLRAHMKVHAGVKNWKCEYCGKAFVRKENLTDHLRVHTGERPFVCETCGKDFNQTSALKTHKKNQH